MQCHYPATARQTPLATGSRASPDLACRRCSDAVRGISTRLKQQIWAHRGPQQVAPELPPALPVPAGKSVGNLVYDPWPRRAACRKWTDMSIPALRIAYSLVQY